jgi:hypothetical protein
MRPGMVRKGKFSSMAVALGRARLPDNRLRATISQQNRELFQKICKKRPIPGL